MVARSREGSPASRLGGLEREVSTFSLSSNSAPLSCSSLSTDAAHLYVIVNLPCCVDSKVGHTSRNVSELNFDL